MKPQSFAPNISFPSVIIYLLAEVDLQAFKIVRISELHSSLLIALGNRLVAFAQDFLLHSPQMELGIRNCFVGVHHQTKKLHADCSEGCLREKSHLTVDQSFRILPNGRKT